MQKMHEHMKEMQAEMKAIHAEKDLDKRKQLMQAHRKSMHEHMQMMHGMMSDGKMGGGMMMGMHGGADKDHVDKPKHGKGAMMDPNARMGMMEKRMDMMQMMMDQMMQHQEARIDTTEEYLTKGAPK